MRSAATIRILLALALTIAFGFVLAACSDDGGAEIGSASGTRNIVEPDPDPLFAVLQDEGRPVVGTADGFSLYIFDGDGRNQSVCVDQCALTFIPFAVPDGPRTAGDQLDPNLVGKFEREDGVWQVTYAGRALYRFSADTNPGDSGGEGSAGRWHLLSPEGDRVPQPGS